MQLGEVTNYNLRSQTILNESWQDLTESQRLYIGRWEKELWPLLEEYTKQINEATLTVDQIEAIFKGAEAQAMAGGDNKNILGKAGSAAGAVAKLPVDIAKKVDAKINELGKAAKNAGPVKNMDQKFNQLKTDIMATKPDNKIVQGIVKVSDWAKANPGKASIAVGILTAIAAFAGGPMGGAAAGLILRSTNELLKGEDLSSAIGKSIKTAAYGAIAGWALQGIGDWLEGLRFDAVPYEKAPGLTTIDVGFQSKLSAPGFTAIDKLGSMVVPESEVGRFTDLLNTMKAATSGTGTTTDPAALNAFDEMLKFARTFDAKWWLESNKVANDLAQAIAAENDAFLQNLTTANQAIASIAQGSIQGAGEKGAFKVGGDEVKPGDVVTSAAGNKKIAGVDSKATTTDPSDLAGRAKIAKAAGESVDMETEFERFLAEAGVMDKIKSGVKSAAGAVAGGAKAVGKELGNKVTYNKLMKQWKGAGEPSDTASIMNILQDAGLSNDQIANIGQEAKVDLGKPSEQPKASEPATGSEPAPSGEQPSNTATQPTGDTKVEPSEIQKGDTREVNGKTYKWMGALWVDTATNKPIGILPSMKAGLPNPKLDPIIQAAKNDPELAKLIKAQVTSKGVEAGTSGAQQAAQAGVKGTEKLDAKGVSA
jgi:hypothetical protein